MWNEETCIISAIIEAVGSIPKNIHQTLQKLGITYNISTWQKLVVLFRYCQHPEKGATNQIKNRKKETKQNKTKKKRKEKEKKETLK